MYRHWISKDRTDEIKGFLDNPTEVTLFDGTPENPTQIAVEQAAKLYQEMDCDGIITLGGGSLGSR